MKIRKLELTNIGPFDQETIEFQKSPKGKPEIHIFTGENGTGKTTLLMVLASAFQSQQELNQSQTNSLRKRLRNPNNKFSSARITLAKKKENHRIRLYKSYKDNLPSLDLGGLENKGWFNESRSKIKINELDYGVFAYSGYRRIKSEKIYLFDNFEEDPLYQALEFIKDENSKFTVNQWLGRNLQKRALAFEENNQEKERFEENIKNFEKVIADIVGFKIRFKLKTDLSLVLIKDNEELDFDVLPDGLKSLISWLGDLLMRLDSLKWKDDTPIFDRQIILFLDEIEVHLHPAWQRKVLPVIQKLFKNSQIFLSTHSPFVINSIDDAWVYKLELENGRAKVADVVKSEDGISYQTVLSEIFGIDEEFGGKTQEDLDKFYDIVRNGEKVNEKDLIKLAKSLAVQSEELNSIVQIELRQLSRRKGKKISL